MYHADHFSMEDELNVCICLHSRQLVVDHVAGLGLYHLWNWILATNSAQSLFVFCSASCSYPVSAQSHGITVVNSKGSERYPGIPWITLDSFAPCLWTWQTQILWRFRLAISWYPRFPPESGRRTETSKSHHFNASKCLPGGRFSMH